MISDEIEFYLFQTLRMFCEISCKWYVLYWNYCIWVFLY